MSGEARRCQVMRGRCGASAARTASAVSPACAAMDRQRKNRHRRRRDSDPESSARRATDRKQERHRSKPADSPPSSCPRVVLLRPATTAGAAVGSAPPSRSQSPLSQPLSQPLPEDSVETALFRPAIGKEGAAVRVQAPRAVSCFKLIDPQTWTGWLIAFAAAHLTALLLNSRQSTILWHATT